MLLRRDKENGQTSIVDRLPLEFSHPKVSVFSPDSRFVYTTIDDARSADGGEGAIVVSRREGDALTHVETNYGRESCFASSFDLCHHPNGKWLYVAGRRAHVIAVCDVDPETGKLTVKQINRDESDGIHGLEQVMGVVISPDRKFVYSVSGRFSGDNAVSVFKIQEDGRLAVVQEFIAGEDACMSEFAGGNKIAVSPDGTIVIATGTRSATLVVFDRDLETGRLSYVETIPVSSGSTMFNVITAGLGPAGICFDPSGEFFYVALEGDKSIAVFKRKP